jgi:hypothetical protein
MLLFIKIIVLVGLIRLLMATESPILCAALYAGVAVLLSLAAERELPIVLTTGTIGFCLAFAYFWMLDRMEGSGLYWVVLIVGLLIGMV